MGLFFFLILEIVLDLRRCKGAERKLSQRYFRKILLTVVIFPFLLIHFKNHLTTYLQCSSPQRYPSNRKKTYHRFYLVIVLLNERKKTKRKTTKRTETEKRKARNRSIQFASIRQSVFPYTITHGSYAAG